MGLQNSNLPGCTRESLNTSLETVGDKIRAEGLISLVSQHRNVGWLFLDLVGKGGRFPVQYANNPNIFEISHKKNVMESGYETLYIICVGVGFHFGE